MVGACWGGREGGTDGGRGGSDDTGTDGRMDRRGVWGARDEAGIAEQQLSHHSLEVDVSEEAGPHRGVDGDLVVLAHAHELVDVERHHPTERELPRPVPSDQLLVNPPAGSSVVGEADDERGFALRRREGVDAVADELGGPHAHPRPVLLDDHPHREEAGAGQGAAELEAQSLKIRQRGQIRDGCVM